MTEKVILNLFSRQICVYFSPLTQQEEKEAPLVPCQYSQLYGRELYDQCYRATSDISSERSCAAEERGTKALS